MSWYVGESEYCDRSFVEWEVVFGAPDASVTYWIRHTGDINGVARHRLTNACDMTIKLCSA